MTDTNTATVKEAYSDKISSARDEHEFTGGSVITKKVDGYGPYAYLVGPPSAGRPWVYLGKADGKTTGSSGTETTDSSGNESEVEEVTRGDLPSVEDIPPEYTGWATFGKSTRYYENGEQIGYIRRESPKDEDGNLLRDDEGRRLYKHQLVIDGEVLEETDTKRSENLGEDTEEQLVTAHINEYGGEYEADVDTSWKDDLPREVLADLIESRRTGDDEWADRADPHVEEKHEEMMRMAYEGSNGSGSGSNGEEWAAEFSGTRRDVLEQASPEQLPADPEKIQPEHIDHALELAQEWYETRNPDASSQEIADATVENAASFLEEAYYPPDE